MRRLIELLALAFAVGAAASYGQGTVPADPCGARPAAGSAAAKNFLTFDRFDKELRAALAGQDALALAFLVQFPLRVHEASGFILIGDAGALKAHFQDVFPAELRKDVLTGSGEAHCSEEGLMYGAGSIWVQANDRGYAVYVVNRGSVGPEKKQSRIDFTCQTLSHRIAIDTLANGTLRYRSWNKPKPLSEAPDLDLTGGTQTFMGTSVCAVPNYTFKNGSTTYTVEAGMGCDAGPDTPKDAKGSLVVDAGKKTGVLSWCY